MTSFKIFIGDEIRRFRLENLIYDLFVEKLSQTIPNFHPEMKITYEDIDKDKIVISSEIEWKEMITHLSEVVKDDVIKLWITDTKTKQYFKDGGIESMRIYSEKNDVEAEVSESFTEKYSFLYTSAISRLFPGNVILPYNIPSYLQEVLDVKCIKEGVADVDIKISDLFGHLNKTALQFMDNVEEYSLCKAKLILESLLILQPDNPNVYYNLACVECLRKNVQTSLDYLQEAFKAGYDDIQHLCSDPDLTFLRSHEEWLSFLKSVKVEVEIKVESKVEAEAEVKVEAKVEEPKVEVQAKVEEQPALDHKWGKEMQTLSEMGFDLTKSTVISILDHHKGDIDGTLSDLL